MPFGYRRHGPVSAGRILRKRVAERHVQIHLKEQHPFMPGQRRLKVSLAIESEQIGGIDCEDREVLPARRLPRLLTSPKGVVGLFPYVAAESRGSATELPDVDIKRKPKKCSEGKSAAAEGRSAEPRLRHLKGLCEDSEQLEIAPKPRSLQSPKANQNSRGVSDGGSDSGRRKEAIGPPPFEAAPRSLPEPQNGAKFGFRAPLLLASAEVDIYSPADDYSPEIWQAARACSTVPRQREEDGELLTSLRARRSESSIKSLFLFLSLSLRSLSLSLSRYFASLPESEALLPGGAEAERCV